MPNCATCNHDTQRHRFNAFNPVTGHATTCRELNCPCNVLTRRIAGEIIDQSVPCTCGHIFAQHAIQNTEPIGCYDCVTCPGFVNARTITEDVLKINAKSKAKSKMFLLGADPEFGFTENGRNVSANNVMDEGDDDLYQATFGLDGSGRVAEIRPDPSETPQGLVENIRKALAQGYRTHSDIRAYKWKAGSMVGGEPIGGHIHFGVIGIFNEMRDEQRFFNYAGMTKFLDIYLAQTVILLEAEREARRRRESYGMLGDHRAQNHGFEYRTVSSWLTCPEIALGVLSLAKASAHEYMFGDRKEFDKSSLLLSASYYNSCTRSEYIKHFPALQKNISKFELYKDYKEAIDTLFILIEKNKTWFPGDEDMTVAWGLDVVPLPKKLPVKRVSEIF